MLRKGLLYYVTLLSLKCCNHKQPSEDACILKQTHDFSQQWKAIYSFFYCFRSPLETSTCKNNVTAHNQRRHIFKDELAVQYLVTISTMFVNSKNASPVGSTPRQVNWASGCSMVLESEDQWCKNHVWYLIQV